MASTGKDEWDAQTRRRWFYAALVASGLSVLWILWPFFVVIVYAGVVAAASRPLHRTLTARVGDRPHLAAVLTTLLIAVLVVWPLLLLLYQFALEGVAVAKTSLDGVAAGALDTWWTDTSAALHDALPAAVTRYLPKDFDPASSVLGPTRQALTTALTAASAWLPQVVNGVAAGVLDAVLFVFTVITLLAEGPRLKRFLFDLSPLEERYEQRLLEVFDEFATNMVVGAFVVAAAQGAVATVGYWMFGVPRAMFFGVVTAVCAFVPLVGTMLVAVPLAIYMGAVHGWVWGVALGLYAGGVVASVDNVLRPMIIRGSSEIHPLLIFFGVFGGMSWLGVPGLMIGPILVAFFLALAALYREDVLGLDATVGDAPAEDGSDDAVDPTEAGPEEDGAEMDGAEDDRGGPSG